MEITEITTLAGPIARFKEDVAFPEGPYYIGESYTGSYFIEKRITYDLQLECETNFSSDEIKLEGKLHEGKLYIKIKEKIKINITPKSLGEKNFKFFVMSTMGREKGKKIFLLEKKFWIQQKSLVIEGRAEKELPATMKLGEKAEVIFLFNNTGNQTATGINIEVKQIKA